MSMISGKDEIVEVGYKLQYIDDTKNRIQKALDKIKRKNRTSRSILKIDELSLEGTNESGKITGRIEAIKIILNELGYKLEEFNF